jgi:hypothetical protein
LYEGRKKLRAILICLKGDVGSTEKDGGYKKHEPSVICLLLIFIIF